MRQRTRTAASLAAWLAVLGSVLVGSPAHADWPVARHDLRRTAAATGQSDIVAPIPYWRLFLGGRTDVDSVLAGDIDADAAPEVLYVDTGRVVARRPDGTLVWESPRLGITRMVGVSDLDGDAVPDVVAASSDHAYVLGGPDGAVAWAEPDGEMGSLAVVRLADLDGDALPDLLMQEHGCGSVNSGETGFAYSFAAGFSTPALLYELPWHTCGAGVTTVLDLDGAGTPALVVPTVTNDGLALLDAATGAVIAETPPFSGFVSIGVCAAADLDALAGEELVCNQNYPGYGGERQVFAVRYTPTPTPSLSVAWIKVIGEKDGGDLAMNADGIVDLDGDGTVEVVASGKTAAGWTTHVFAGATGTELATIASARFQGTAATGAANERLVLADVGGALTAFAYRPGASPPIGLQWSLPARVLPEAVDWRANARQSLQMRGAHADLDADGREDVVVLGGATGTVIEAFSAPDGVTALLGQLTLPALVAPVAFWMLPTFGTAGTIVGVGRNDGYLSLLDGGFESLWGGANGMRVGGYYSDLTKVGRAPVAASLGGHGAESVLVVDSRGALARIDPIDAAFVAPPKPLWQVNAVAPAIVAGADQGAPAIACFRRTEPPGADPAYDVSLLRPDGSILWTRAFPWTPALDIIPGNLDGDGTPDYFVQGYDAQTEVHTRGLRGTDGGTLWDHDPVPMLGGVQLFSASDWNADGRTDLLTVLGNLRALSGADGSSIGSSPASYFYFAPILYDVDANGSEEVVLQGGALPIRALAHDLVTPLWTSTDEETPMPYGAIAECQAAPPRLMGGSYVHPARLKVTPLSGPEAGVATTFVLAGGKRYDTEAAATADGVRMAQLGRVSVEADLTGVGRPSAVVGSVDGWLYAVNPCTGALDFALDFGAPVGESIFADTDGDGRDEILVTVADGYLYNIRNKVIDAPPFVWDIDPAHGVVDQDLEDVETRESLSGRWGAVAGATGYEVAVVDESASFVTSPIWQPVGTELEATVTGLPLEDGARYVFAVRALSEKGPSVDVASDGAVVHFPPEHPEGGAGGAGGTARSAGDVLITGRACGCRGAGRAGANAGLALFGLVLATALGRRRRGAGARRDSDRKLS
ncbi:MAG: VCBS repeat-containing protein [Myxococcales bacterium]|nr:VCBS repeat-containing protein [Myxococcales bacterium]